MSVVAQNPLQAESSQEPTDLPAELQTLLARVRLHARLRVNWLRELCASTGGTAGSITANRSELEVLLGDRDKPELEEQWRAQQAEYNEIDEIEKGLRNARGSRMSEFEQIFGLTRIESDVLQACLALALDPALARLYAYVQDHAGRSYVNEELAARLFGHGRSIGLSSESALTRWELIAERELAPHEPHVLTLDSQVRDWFLGKLELDRALIGIAQLHPVLPPLPSWPIRELARFIIGAISGDTAAPVRITISGTPGSGRKTLAAAISRELNLPLLTIDADSIDEADWRRLFMRAQRQAFLDRSALAWYGEALVRRPWPHSVVLFPVQFAVVEPGQHLPPVGVVERRFEMPVMNIDERRELWRQYVPSSATWPQGELDHLAERYLATPGDIAAAVRNGSSAVEACVQHLREAGRGKLGQLAQRLEGPFNWDDLVIQAGLREALEDLVFEAQARNAFWAKPEAQRLFPQGRGLLALFTGPPGTGKTMAAQVIAAQLGLDLYRVDLSALVSKWVGETSQNLERLLQRAGQMDVVLFFDEADAIYGKRVHEIRDAQDRFANMDVSHLMVAIESYPGIVLLATNMKGNIDPAFLRRIRYCLEFVKPGMAERLEIWRKVTAGLHGQEHAAVLDDDLRRIAQIEATGAQIKNAVLDGTFMAQREGKPLALAHLVRGLNREFAKEGYALSGSDCERLLKQDN